MDPLPERRRPFPREGDGHHRRLGACPHRCQVAEVDRQRLVADARWGCVAAEEEVDPFGEEIDGHDRAASGRWPEHRGVVPRRHLEARVAGEAGEEPVDERRFQGESFRGRGAPF